MKVQSKWTVLLQTRVMYHEKRVFTWLAIVTVMRYQFVRVVWPRHRVLRIFHFTSLHLLVSTESRPWGEDSPRMGTHSRTSKSLSPGAQGEVSHKSRSLKASSRDSIVLSLLRRQGDKSWYSWHKGQALFSLISIRHKLMFLTAPRHRNSPENLWYLGKTNSRDSVGQICGRKQIRKSRPCLWHIFAFL